MHFNLNHFVAAKRSEILKGVTATGEGHLHVSMFACSHPLLAVMTLDSMELFRVTLTWLFTSGRSSLPKASSQLFCYWYDTRPIGISRRVILVCHTKRDPVLHRISSPVHSATTDIEPKTAKSPLCRPAHGERSPCSFPAFPATLAFLHSHICPDSIFFAAHSAPLKAITGGMLVM